MTQPEHRPRVVVIAGPTASGKTGCALRIARVHDGELIGADSVQVYRGFDIGSAKPSAQELDGVPHHLIDVVDHEDDARAASRGSERRVELVSIDVGVRDEDVVEPVPGEERGFGGRERHQPGVARRP